MGDGSGKREAEGREGAEVSKSGSKSMSKSKSGKGREGEGKFSGGLTSGISPVLCGEHDPRETRARAT